MDFNLTDSQLLLQRSVKEFTKQEIEPRACEIDETGKLPDDLIGKMADINLPGMVFPAGYGGISASCMDTVLAIEQIAYSGSGAWWLVAFTNSIPECILESGTGDQKNKYLPAICDGDIYPSIQFTEEETGSDPDALTTTASFDDGCHVINGVKRFSTFGARKGFAITYAKDAMGRCNAYIIEKYTPGYTTSEIYSLMGGGGIEAVDVYLDNVRVPEENMLGKPGDGLNILQSWIAVEKIQQCGACIGIAQAALDEARRYAKNRMVKNKPMAALLTIRSVMADMHAKLEAMRWLTYRSAFLRDQDAPNWKVEAAAAKIFVVPTALQVVDAARQIHGAYGYSKEYKIERLYRAIAGASAIAVSLDINRTIVGSAALK